MEDYINNYRSQSNVVYVLTLRVGFWVPYYSHMRGCRLSRGIHDRAF